jgi:mono/diheme cytochrome c family protein
MTIIYHKYLPNRPLIVVTILLLGGWISQAVAEEPRTASVSVAAPTASTNEDFDSDIQPFFATFCVRCHGGETTKGGLSLQDLGNQWSTDEEVETWESVLEMLKFGEMPPIDEPQPKEAEIAKVSQWIDSKIRERAQKTRSDFRESKTRRLTNLEYQNTLRDLIGFELEILDDLPNDPEKPYEFNNTPELMRMGPEQIDRYLEVARKAMASAIVDPGPPEIHQTRREWPKHNLDRGLAWDEVGVFGNSRHTVATGMGLKSFPKTGEFRIRLQTSAILPPGYTQVPLRLIMGNDIQVNSSTREVREVGVVSLSNSPDEPQIIEFRGRIENFSPLPGQTVNGKRQPDRMSITPQNIWDDGSLNDRFSYGNLRNIDLPRIVIEWIEFESPLTDVWPPEHHTAILFQSPLRESDPPAYVRAVIQRFMTRAYRRPVGDEEVAIFARVYDLVSKDLETMEAAMRETLAMVLVSPQFLYHTEWDDATDPHFAMASRLSYFRWASRPDQELLNLAANQQLNAPDVIQQQVLRMLEDDRAAQFIESFTTQWLSLRKMKTVPINRDLFPRFLYYVPAGERAGTEMPYLPTVRDYMLAETLGFMRELIRRNASVTQVVDSDFAVLNERLAKHYGVEGVEGVDLRPVPLPADHHLGGLLTQGSVLIGNGTGTAPHPIYRAVWLREAILGDEVPDPPAEVPALSDSAGESAETALTIAGLLKKHRSVESCNDCHFRLDPWGIPFEHYNAVGQFQPRVPKEGTRVTVYQAEQHGNMSGYQSYLDSINTEEVEATSQVPHGPHVSGMNGLKKHLLDARSDDIVENMIRRLLSYSLGRKLTYRDRLAIEQLITATLGNQHGIRSVIVEICKSDVFRTPTSDQKE